MKKLSTSAVAIAMLIAVLGAAFQVGRSVGFKTGSEWALVQADIVAREAGLFMPVSMENDNFRIVFKQPRGLYKKAWELADRHEGAGNAMRSTRLERVQEHQNPKSGIKIEKML